MRRALETPALIVATFILAVAARGQGLFGKAKPVAPAVKDAATMPVTATKAGPMVLEVLPPKPQVTEVVVEPSKPKEVVKVRPHFMRPEVGEVERPRGSFLVRAEPGSQLWEAYPNKLEPGDPVYTEGLEDNGAPTWWVKLPWKIPDSGELLLWEAPPPWRQRDDIPRIHRYIAVEYPDTGTWAFRKVVFRKGQRNVLVDLRRGK